MCDVPLIKYINHEFIEIFNFNLNLDLKGKNNLGFLMGIETFTKYECLMLEKLKKSSI